MLLPAQTHKNTNTSNNITNGYFKAYKHMKPNITEEYHRAYKQTKLKNRVSWLTNFWPLREKMRVHFNILNTPCDRTHWAAPQSNARYVPICPQIINNSFQIFFLYKRKQYQHCVFKSNENDLIKCLMKNWGVDGPEQKMRWRNEGGSTGIEEHLQSVKCEGKKTILLWTVYCH